MNIVVFSDSFYPELSGIADSILILAKELAVLGHRLDFYVPKYSEKDFHIFNVPAKELELGHRITIHRLPSIRVPASSEQAQLIIPTFLRALSIRKHKPDIIHTQLFFSAGLEALVASRFLKVPLIGTSHTPIAEFLPYSPIQSKTEEKIGQHFVSWYYNRCDFVTAASQGILDEMKKYGFNRPCKVISNPVETKLFYPVAAEEKLRIKRDFNFPGFVVLYTGRLAVEKHVDVIVRAIDLVKEKIPDICFAITGHGKAETALRKLVMELDMERHVRFFGTLTADRHALMYKAADVFAIASTAETQSLSLMKAMATGIPVIGVNARALPEYINKENGFVVEPGDYHGLADVLVLLSRDPHQREALGRGGFESVQRFSPDIIANEWIRLYKQVGSQL
jgi:1,2-diacylglycerol 3-alpha-glucosyltransferase